MRAQELRQAVQDCRARALYASAKWAAAALCGLPEEDLMGSSQQASTSGGSGAAASPAYELARCLFDQKVCRRGGLHCPAAVESLRWCHHPKQLQP